MFARMGGWLRPLALVTAVCPLVAWAVTPEEAEQLLKDLSPGIEIKSVTPSEVPGFVLLEITGGAFLHMTPDGKHFFAGDLYRVGPDGLTNVMEDKRNLARKSLIDSVDESEMLVFAPPSKSLKATVTVFTDVDCGYCQKLHREVPKLNALGIAVRYLAYPRNGIGKGSYGQMVSAWCADDPTSALTRAKRGQKLKVLNCSNPVASHYDLGVQVGITGTPTMILPDGKMIPGFLPAERLAAELGVDAQG
jgi:thiol:disulfide interchange protein DsbC